MSKIIRIKRSEFKRLIQEQMDDKIGVGNKPWAIEVLEKVNWYKAHPHKWETAYPDYQDMAKGGDGMGNKWDPKQPIWSSPRKIYPNYLPDEFFRRVLIGMKPFEQANGKYWTDQAGRRMWDYLEKKNNES